MRASSLLVTQHSDPYRKIGNIQARPPELVDKALHCCTRECTPSHDVWKAVSWRVDESAKVDKFLHCSNLLLQHCDGRGTS